jgi:phosphoribosylformylglycinamidine synthase PurS subunit
VSLYSAMVEVSLRPGIADPQGATIERALPALGFQGISGVRAGKSFRFTVDAPDEEAARREVDDLCHRLLSNPVIEDARVTLSAMEAAT